MAEQVDRRVVQLDVIINGLDDVKRRLGEVEKSSKALEDRFTSLTETAKHLAEIVGVGALLELAKHAIEAEARLYKLSEQTGASVESLSQFQQVAALSGTSLDSLALAMGRMEKSMYQSTQTQGSLKAGTMNAAGAFKTLGLSVTDASGALKDPDAMLKEIAIKMEGFRDGAGKTALAMQIFGRAGAQLIPFMHDLANNLDVTAVVTREEARAAEELEKGVNKLLFAKKALAQQIISEGVPVLLSFVDIMLKASTSSGSFADNIHRLKDEGSIASAFKEAGTWIAFVVDYLRVTAQTMSTLWSLFELFFDYLRVTSAWFDQLQVKAVNFGIAVQEALTPGLKLPRIDTKPWDDQLRVALKDKDAILLSASEKLGKLLEMDTTKVQTEYAKQIAMVELLKKYDDPKYWDTRDIRNHTKTTLAAPADEAGTRKAQSDLAALNAMSASASLQLSMGDEKVTEAKKRLLEIESSPEWKTFNKTMQDQIIAAGNHADALQKEVAAMDFFQKSKVAADKLLAVSTADYLNGTLKLTSAEKLLLELQQNPQWKTLTTVQQEQIKATLTKASATELATEIDKKMLDGEQALVKAYEDQKKKIDDNINSLVDSNKLMQFEVDEIGKSTVQKALDNNERERTLALLKAQDPLQKQVINNLYNERARLIDLGAQRKDQMDLWNGMADAAANFFADLLVNGKKAFDNLKNQVKQFAEQLLAVFAKSYILNMAANAAGGSGTSAGTMLGGMANNALTSSVGGSLLTSAGSYMGGGAFTAAGGVGTASLWGTGALTGAGDFVGTGLAGMAGNLALAAGATDTFAAAIAAAVPVIGWVVAIGAILYAIFGKSGGGAKGGGSASLTADSAGNVTNGGQLPGFDTDNNRFYTPNQADSSILTMLHATNSGYQNTLAALGGKQNGNVVFGLGFDKDPNGDSPNRVSAGVTVNGQSVYGARNVTAGKDDTDLQNELQLQIERMMVSALKASDLPQDIAGVLNKVDVASASKDFLDQVMTFIGSMATLKQALDIDPQVAANTLANQTMEGQWRSERTVLQQLARTYDGTAAGAASLTQATMQYQQAQVQLIATYDQAGKSIDQNFGQTIRGIKYQTLDKQGQYNFLQDESATALQQALSSGSVDEINSLSQKINSDINTAFSLLSPEDQKAQAQSFIDKAAAANADIQKHLNELKKELADEGKDQISQIKVIITDAANKFADSADKNVTASDNNLTASTNNLDASKSGGTVEVHVYDDRVTTNVVNNGG